MDTEQRIGQAGHHWRPFTGQIWRDNVDVAAFIRDNHRPYEGGAEFLTRPTSRTLGLWERLREMFVEERRRGIYDVDPATPRRSPRTHPATSTATTN